MPPKKRVPARRAPGKRVRIGDSTTIPSPAVSPSGRSLRQAAVGINYKLTRTNSPRTNAKNSQGTQDVTTETPKRRGRPPASESTPKAPTTEPVKAVRGTPKKSVTETAPAESLKSTKRKRAVDEEPVNDPPKKRGRPPKTVDPVPAPAPAPVSRKALPKKVEKEETKAKVKAAPKKAVAKPAAIGNTVIKRGRPAGSKSKEPNDVSAKVTKSKAPKKSAKAGGKAATRIEPEGEFVEGLTQPEEQGASDFQYWLMKAEPETRIEKGVDVAYPIDKLMAATEPEPWDGVRNAVARNNMRAMRKGDLAFFYHSNCNVPGIVGVMRIAEEHSVDESAFDPTHPYYDEKSSRDKPKWDCVKVEHVKKFDSIITLKELKSTPELANMQIAQKAYGRLSVQSVAPIHWQFVLKMADEPADLGVPSTVSGYEADTNGETDKEVVEDSIGAEDGDVDVDGDRIAADRLAAYGNPGDEDRDEDDADKQLNGDTAHAINEEVQAEKDRVGAIDAFAKEVTSGGVSA